MGYPTSVVAFSTKNAGDTVQSSHPNDLQTEMTAVESALLTGGLAHAIFPSADDGFALGSASKSWADLFLASGGIINWNNGNFTITHSAGILTLSGTVTAATVNTLSGVTASIATATPTTIFAAASAGHYFVTMHVPDAGALYLATATIIHDATTVLVHNLVKGANCNISVSGANVQVTQSSGGNAIVAYSVLRTR